VELHEQYGDIFTLRVSSMARADPAQATKSVVFVRKPEDCRTVLLSDSFGKTWDAEDVGTSTVDYVHNLIQPMLTGTVFNQQGTASPSGVHPGRATLRAMFIADQAFTAGFSHHVDGALDKLACEGREEVDILELSHDLIRESLFVVIAGGAAQATHDATHEIFHEAMAYFVDRYSPVEHSAAVNSEDELWMARLHDAGRTTVDGWRAYFDTLGAAEKEAQKEASTMLAVMDRAGFSRDEMAAMLVNAVIAGSEAPASSLAQTLQELAFNPPVQALLAKEVADHGTGDMQKLGFTQAVMMEGLRRFAPATLVQRVAFEDQQLSGYEIPAGTVVGVCVTAVHKHDAIFGQPAWDFIPEREEALDLDMLKRKNTFMTFSGGPRGCPGKHIGVEMCRVALAKVVERLELLPSAGPGGAQRAAGSSIPKFVEWEIGGIPLRVAARGGARAQAGAAARRQQRRAGAQAGAAASSKL
jgi:cytochrome P450